MNGCMVSEDSSINGSLEDKQASVPCINKCQDFITNPPGILHWQFLNRTPTLPPWTDRQTPLKTLHSIVLDLVLMK